MATTTICILALGVCVIWVLLSHERSLTSGPIAGLEVRKPAPGFVLYDDERYFSDPVEEEQRPPELGIQLAKSIYRYRTEHDDVR
jgi:hypothetical protein